MKKLFLASVATVALFCSCSKEDNEITELKKGSIVNLSFTEDASTRAFFGTTASAETWEKSLSSITMFAFNTTGNLILQRSFSSAELTAKKASFALPEVTPGTSCEFYAVANLTTATITSKTALLALLESNPASYNGTFAEVSSSTKRAAGFVMTGNVTQVTAAAGATTNVNITLKRTVAKVAMEITPSASFGTIYPGMVRINNVVITKSAVQSPIIKPATPNTGAMSFTHTQASNTVSGKYQNLFYLFENGNLAAGSRVMATINATYDLDGNFTTTTDQKPMTYNVELTGTAAGAISRNGYYRVDVDVHGLAGSDATISITVADWETPVTQTISVGM